MNLGATISLGIMMSLFGAREPTLRVRLPKEQFKPLERITAEVENRGEAPITFCLEIGQTSPAPNEDGVESTPSPFIVQANSAGKWHTLMIGPDVGSSRHPVVLEADKSLPFPLRLRQEGKFRLLLSYWVGNRPELDCGHPPRGEKRLESRSFSVQ